MNPSSTTPLKTKSNRVGVIVGILRKASYSRRVARALMERAPDNWECTIIEIADLPLYNRSIPGALKHATDIGSRPQGENVFDGLPPQSSASRPTRAARRQRTTHCGSHSSIST